MIELVGMGRAFDDVLAVEGVLSTLFFFFCKFFLFSFWLLYSGNKNEGVCLLG